MLIKTLRGWEIPERKATPEAFYLSRRQFIKKLGWGGIGAAMTLSGWDRAMAARRDNAKSIYPAKRNEKFVLDRPLTDEAAMAYYSTTGMKLMWRSCIKLKM